jgi:hypothetical protein
VEVEVEVPSPLACQSSIFLGAGRGPVLASKKMLATGQHGQHTQMLPPASILIIFKR